MRLLLIALLPLTLVACGKNASAPAAPTSGNTVAPAAALGPSDVVGYPSVAAAKAAIGERKDVEAREDNGWTIVADPAASAFWSFTPADNAAYPAVVKRTIHEKDGVVSVTMDALCEAPQAACDHLKHEFEDLDERMRADLQQQADARKK